MSTIFLIRHGQASAGTHDYDRLSELGQQQSRLLGEWWQRTGFNADAAFAGSLLRQRHTAELTLSAAGLDTHTHDLPLLDEYDHHSVDQLFGDGIRSDMPDGLSIEQYTDIMDRWRLAEAQRLNGLEAWREFSSRGWQAVQQAHQLNGSHGRFLLFTSGGIIATLLSQVLGLGFNATIDVIWRIRNASVTTLEYDGEHARLIDFNTIGHLHAEADASLVTLI